MDHTRNKTERHVEEIVELSNEEMEVVTGGATRLAAGGASRTNDHKIDMSVCDLATFDFDECLG